MENKITIKELAPYMEWWNDPHRDRFGLLKKYGYQDEKKPWKYRPLTNKGIYLIWSRENDQ